MDGLYVAIPFGMTNSAAIHRNRGIASVVRVVRAFAEASLIALAFGLAILVIGAPMAFTVRIVHDGLTWHARSGGELGAAAGALVTVASIAGGAMLTAAFARVLGGFFRWRAARGET